MRKSAGFTLLEVLVALVIMGIAVTYIIQLFSANLRSISTSGNYVNAAIRADVKMRQILDDDQLVEESLSEVTNDGYRMDITVSNALSERYDNLQVKLLEITLTAYWQQGNKEKSLTLSTLKVVGKSKSELESLKEL
ncbi:MAG: type II secretion system protein [Pseudomonadota bacterium]